MTSVFMIKVFDKNTDCEPHFYAFRSHFFHLSLVSKNKEKEKEPLSHTGQSLNHFHVTCEKQQESLMAIMWLERNGQITDPRS